MEDHGEWDGHLWSKDVDDERSISSNISTTSEVLKQSCSDEERKIGGEGNKKHEDTRDKNIEREEDEFEFGTLEELFEDEAGHKISSKCPNEGECPDKIDCVNVNINIDGKVGLGRSDGSNDETIANFS